MVDGRGESPRVSHEHPRCAERQRRRSGLAPFRLGLKTTPLRTAGMFFGGVSHLPNAIDLEREKERESTGAPSDGSIGL